MVKKVLAGCNVSLFGKHAKWTEEQYKKLPKWLSHLSGRLQGKFDSSVTHLVVSKKRWDESPRPRTLQNAVDAVQSGGIPKIVSFDWLEDSLNGQTKKREAPYEWLKMEEAAAKVQAKGKKAKEKEEKAAARSVPGIMQEVFDESTEQFVNPKEKEKIEKQLAREAEQRKTVEEEAKREKARKKKELARGFQRNSKKGVQVLMSKEYHIYTDATGFKYDILITKIDVRANKNERFSLNLNLQLWEHNLETNTNYAMAAQFSGTNLASSNNVIATIGSTWEAAYHAFKAEFKTYTGNEWDERISAHIKRMRQDKLDRGVGTGRPAPGSTRGVPVPQSAARPVKFEDKKFEYHPPGYGPKGEITEAERDRLKELGVNVVDGTKDRGLGPRTPAVAPVPSEIEGDAREVVEEWMKGADMSDAAFEAALEAEGFGYPHGTKGGEEGQQQEQLNAGATEDGNGAAVETTLNHTSTGINAEADEISQEIRIDASFNDDEVRQNTAEATQLETQTQQSAIEDFDFNAPDYQQGDFNSAATDNQDDSSWDAAAQLPENMDMSWFDAEIANMQKGVPAAAGGEVSSLQPEGPSFTGQQGGDEISFQHGTQEIGETQIADRVRGEFFEDLNAPTDSAMPTPPASTKKSTNSQGDIEVSYGNASKKSNGLLGGLNFGSSLLGKRKATSGADEGAKKSAKLAESGDGEI